jgi:hypothetical protein
MGGAMNDEPFVRKTGALNSELLTDLGLEGDIKLIFML